ncbi:MAG: hypothetical protein ACE5IO_07100, partial [Thermoplasmata archaeon]
FGVADTSFLLIKAEKIYKDIIHGLDRQKKRYMGDIVWTEDGGFCESRYDVTGAWQIRSDAFQLLKEAENEVTNIMFKHRDNARFYVDKYLSKLRRDLLDGKYREELVLEKGMSKPPTAYAEGNQLRRISEQLLERGEYRPGERLKWVAISKKLQNVTFSENPQKEYALAPDDDLSSLEITHSGYLYYYERVKKMVDVWVPQATEQLTMEAFSS